MINLPLHKGYLKTRLIFGGRYVKVEISFIDLLIFFIVFDKAQIVIIISSSNDEFNNNIVKIVLHLVGVCLFNQAFY